MATYLVLVVVMLASTIYPHARADHKEACPEKSYKNGILHLFGSLIYELRSQVAALQKELQALKDTSRKPEQIIVFFVNYNGADIKVGSTNYIVPFNTVIWNHGNGYDVIRHIFTAKVPGLYAFHVNALSGSTGHGCAWLMKNGQKQTSGWAAQHHSTVHISVGIMLDTGDEVWVEACAKSTMDNDTGMSFSGYLIHAS